nr:calnexin-like [Nerophis lumbriciformis]
MALSLALMAAGVASVSAAEPPGVIESLFLATHQRPWLWAVYVFIVGLPIILFISFMWPDKRFGPPDQQYYYKKSDDVQHDDLESSQKKKPKPIWADRASVRRRDAHGEESNSGL